MARQLLENPSPSTQYMREWRAKNSEHSKTYKREWDRKRREQVLSYYGGECVCCGENTFAFLALDHINGGGNKHRQELKARGSSMINWVINNDFPPIFQILCHNCNQAIGYYGKCPHREE